MTKKSYQLVTLPQPDLYGSWESWAEAMVAAIDGLQELSGDYSEGRLQRIQLPPESVGSATLVAGSVTVSATDVTANSKIFLSRSSLAGTAGYLDVANVVAGTGFDIVSSSGSDTSVVDWFLIEPIA